MTEVFFENRLIGRLDTEKHVLKFTDADFLVDFVNQDVMFQRVRKESISENDLRDIEHCLSFLNGFVFVHPNSSEAERRIETIRKIIRSMK